MNWAGHVTRAMTNAHKIVAKAIHAEEAGTARRGLEDCTKIVLCPWCVWARTAPSGTSVGDSGCEHTTDYVVSMVGRSEVKGVEVWRKSSKSEVKWM